VLLMCGNIVIPHRSSEYWRRGLRGVYDVRSIVAIIKKKTKVKITKLNFS